MIVFSMAVSVSSSGWNTIDHRSGVSEIVPRRQKLAGTAYIALARPNLHEMWAAQCSASQEITARARSRSTSLYDSACHGPSPSGRLQRAYLHS